MWCDGHVHVGFCLLPSPCPILHTPAPSPTANAPRPPAKIPHPPPPTHSLVVDWDVVTSGSVPAAPPPWGLAGDALLGDGTGVLGVPRSLREGVACAGKCQWPSTFGAADGGWGPSLEARPSCPAPPTSVLLPPPPPAPSLSSNHRVRPGAALIRVKRGAHAEVRASVHGHSLMHLYLVLHRSCCCKRQRRGGGGGGGLQGHRRGKEQGRLWGFGGGGPV